MKVAMVAAGGALALATAGGAQTLRMPEGVSDATRARMTIDALGWCLVREEPAKVAAFLKLIPGSRASRDAARQLESDNCMVAARIDAPDTALRGSIFAALYRAEFAVEGETLASPGPDFKAEAAGQPADVAQAYIASRTFAECVVRANEADARALVLAQPGSAAESAAVTALTPAVSACLPAGQTLELSKSTLVKLVAEMLFRLSGGTMPKAGGKA